MVMVTSLMEAREDGVESERLTHVQLCKLNPSHYYNRITFTESNDII